ncbi:UNVERIFIED_CONTAM: hypothetical protein FKN15_036393 [Acipenser sinensis]
MRVAIIQSVLLTFLGGIPVTQCSPQSSPSDISVGFALDLYRVIGESQKDENIVFSPLSVTLALGMVGLGAKETTLHQIRKAIKDNENQEGYFTNDMTELRVLELLYSGDEASLIVILPAKCNDIEYIEKLITAEQIHTWLSEMTKEEVEINLPRFKIEQKINLKKSLRHLNVTEIFESGSNLSRMSDSMELHISKAAHQAFIEVNEEGSEAAASTGMQAAAIMSLQHHKFVADHPFLFIIKHNTTAGKTSSTNVHLSRSLSVSAKTERMAQNSPRRPKQKQRQKNEKQTTSELLKSHNTPQRTSLLLNVSLEDAASTADEGPGRNYLLANGSTTESTDVGHSVKPSMALRELAQRQPVEEDHYTGLNGFFTLGLDPAQISPDPFPQRASYQNVENKQDFQTEGRRDFILKLATALQQKHFDQKTVKLQAAAAQPGFCAASDTHAR